MTIPHTDINNNSKNSQNKTVEKVRKTCNVTEKKTPIPSDGYLVMLDYYFLLLILSCDIIYFQTNKKQ